MIGGDQAAWAQAEGLSHGSMVMAAAVALDACGEATVALDQVTVQYVDGSLVARGGVPRDGMPWRGGNAAMNASAYCSTGINDIDEPVV